MHIKQTLKVKELVSIDQLQPPAGSDYRCSSLDVDARPT